MGPQRARRAVELVALTLIYFAAGKIGLSFAIVNQSASGIWPPSGIALAACLLAGTRVWPAIFVGAFLVNVSTSHAILPSFAIAAGNTLEALAAAWLTRRLARGLEASATAPSIIGYAAAVLADPLRVNTVGSGSAWQSAATSSGCTAGKLRPEIGRKAGLSSRCDCLSRAAHSRVRSRPALTTCATGTNVLSVTRCAANMTCVCCCLEAQRAFPAGSCCGNEMMTE